MAAESGRQGAFHVARDAALLASTGRAADRAPSCKARWMPADREAMRLLRAAAQFVLMWDVPSVESRRRYAAGSIAMTR
jgi:hypothetical protein